MNLSTSELADLNQHVHPGFNVDPAYHDWYRKRGAVAPSEIDIKLTLQGRSEETVLITNLVVVSHCGPSLNGAIFEAGGEGASAVPGIGFDLDSSEPVARRYDVPDNAGAGTFGAPFFSTRNVSLAPKELQSVLLHVKSVQRYCRFTFRATAVDSAGRTTQVIDNAGRPFEVSGILVSNGSLRFSAYRTAYVGGPRNPGLVFVRVNPSTYK